MNDYVRSTKPKYKFYKYDFFHLFKALFSPFFNYTKYKVLKKTIVQKYLQRNT